MLDTREVAARACADHNAVIDLEHLARKGWSVHLAIQGSPLGSLEPWEARLSLAGSDAHRACGASPGEALAKARKWAEGGGAC